MVKAELDGDKNKLENMFTPDSPEAMNHKLFGELNAKPAAVVATPAPVTAAPVVEDTDDDLDGEILDWRKNG